MIVVGSKGLYSYYMNERLGTMDATLLNEYDNYTCCLAID